MKTLLFLTVFALSNYFAQGATLRFFQAVPEETLTFNVLPLGIFNLAYGQATPYQFAADGAYTWNISNSNATQLISLQVPLFGDIYYTYATTESNGTYAIETYYENLQGATNWREGEALFRFIHLAPNQPPVSITNNGSENVLIVNNPYMRDTTYMPVSANVQITLNMNITGWVFDYSLGALNPNTMYTLFLISGSSSLNATHSVQFVLTKDRCYQNYTCDNVTAPTNSTEGSNSTTSTSTDTRTGTSTAATGTNTNTNTRSGTNTNTNTHDTNSRTNTNSNSGTVTNTLITSGSVVRPIEFSSASSLSIGAALAVIIAVAFL